MVDWSKEEKSKIWEAALDGSGKYHDLTFEEFKALIQGEGGYNLVERMAAGAGAVHIERISGPQPQWDPPLAQLHAMRDPSMQLPTGQESSALSSEPSRGDLAGAALGSTAGSDATTVRWAAGPERQQSAVTRGDGSVEADAADDDGRSSSDSEDEGGKKKPALLTKRRGELGRGNSTEGSMLRSPQRSAQLAMLAAAQAGAVDTTAPSELPRKRSASGAIGDESAGLSGGSPAAMPPSPVASQGQSADSACTGAGTTSTVRATLRLLRCCAAELTSRNVRG